MTDLDMRQPTKVWDDVLSVEAKENNTDLGNNTIAAGVETKNRCMQVKKVNTVR